jgi:hypothetical protein
MEPYQVSNRGRYSIMSWSGVICNPSISGFFQRTKEAQDTDTGAITFAESRVCIQTPMNSECILYHLISSHMIISLTNTLDRETSSVGRTFGGVSRYNTLDGENLYATVVPAQSWYLHTARCPHLVILDMVSCMLGSRRRRAPPYRLLGKQPR